MGHREGGLKVDPRGDVVINGVEVVEEGVSPIDPYSASISKGWGVSGDDIEGRATRPTVSCGTPSSSLSRTVS